MTVSAIEACTLCEVQADRYEITGLKTLKNNQQHAYRLCPDCCKKLPPLSLYNPATTKLRREFWNTVWKKLKNTVSGNSKADKTKATKTKADDKTKE